MLTTGWYTVGPSKIFKARLQARLTECRLELHPIKTKIVYCRDGKRRGKYPNVTFDFLGYCFRPRLVQNSRDNTLFCGFTPDLGFAIEQSCPWLISLGRSIRSCGGGSHTMGDTRLRRSNPYFDMSIRHFERG